MALGVEQLRELGHSSFKKLRDHQLPNGLIPASVGRHDDEYFNGGVWVKDVVRAGKFALDPKFQQAFPELEAPAKELYLSSTQALLRIQAQPEQARRFQSRPGEPDDKGYSTIDDAFTPAIKFTAGGEVYQNWRHNQPDNWGTLLQAAGKGIEVGWPVLGDKNEPTPLGSILQGITTYVANLRVERFTCRSIWEHENVWSSYSTRRIVLAGLDQMRVVWSEIAADGKRKGYQVELSPGQIEDAAGSLRDKAAEHFPADYTDLRGHDSKADLASLVVLNDIDLPENEQEEIIIGLKDEDLENRLGFYRFWGDGWKEGLAEAKWTMGKPILARYYFRKAARLYAEGRNRAAFRNLDHGADRIVDILNIQLEHGYIPELFEDKNKDGNYVPNNNELAWTLGYLLEATGAGIVALSASEQTYRQAA